MFKLVVLLALLALAGAALGNVIPTDYIEGDPDPLNVDVVLPPPASKDAALDEAVLIFIPGGKVPATYYSKTVAAIQEASNLRLWAVIPSIPNMLCISSCALSATCTLRRRISDTISTFNANQGPDLPQYTGPQWGPNVFVAGHSLGGLCGDSLVKKFAGTATSYAAYIVMGSYVAKQDVKDYPVPVFTLGAELDGGSARPGVMWKSLVSSDKAARNEGHEIDDEWQMKHKPVAIIPGLDHSSFCPGFRVPGDIFPAEVSLEMGSRMIGSAIAAFLHLHTQQSNADYSTAVATLRQQQQWTRGLLLGFQKALRLEREGDTATWCQSAQKILADLAPADWAKVNIDSAIYVDKSVAFENSRVSTFRADNGVLHVNITGHNAAYPLTDLKDGCIDSAREVGCKLISGARLAKELSTENLGNDISCGQINKFAVKQAENALSQSDQGKKSLQRFRAKGRPILLSADIHPLGDIGQFFSSGHMQDEDCVGQACLNVSALACGSVALDALSVPGVQYCKILSPARVVDYIMTDSLKTMSTCQNKDAQ